MSEIIIKGQKTPTRCEICHKADVFIPYLNSCFRCDNIDVNDVDDVNEFDEHITTSYQHYQYHQQVQTPNYQYQSLTSLANRDNANNPFKTALNNPEKSLILNNLIQFPNLLDRKAETKVKKYRPFPKPKPKLQPNVFFQFVMWAGVVMAILFLFSLFLIR
ncbi:MAG: hypothetical protein WAQ98_18565 [Blastocatellia bacterium]